MMGATEIALPVDSFRDAAPILRRPFTPEAIRFKVQAQWPRDNPTGGMIVAYIDARLVVERLNLVVPHLWTATYEPIGTGSMWCHLTIGGITRRDVGQGQGKGLVSDSLKRAAVHFGIGVSLYAIPKIRLNGGEYLERYQTKNGPALRLTPKGEEHCRAVYGMWLDRQGARDFGDPLDHGDVADSQGDPYDPEEESLDGQLVLDEPAPEPLPAPPPARPIPAAPRASRDKLNLLKVRARQANVDDAGLDARLRARGATRLELLTVQQADELIAELVAEGNDQGSAA